MPVGTDESIMALSAVELPAAATHARTDGSVPLLMAVGTRCLRSAAPCTEPHSLVTVSLHANFKA
jgi:hypothetical protein